MQYTRLLIVLLCLCYVGIATGSDAEYTLYLFRHAEKQADGSKDPALTERGEKRAEQLARWFQNRHINAIWSSDYKRTRDTVKPLLLSLGFEMNTYDPLNQAELAKTLFKDRRNSVVVGHSNTIPELARLLCGCVIADMDESEHDRLITITVGTDKTRMETLHQNQLF